MNPRILTQRRAEGSPVARELDPASICLLPTHVLQALSENEVGEWSYLAARGWVGPAYRVQCLTFPPLWTLREEPESDCSPKCLSVCLGFQPLPPPGRVFIYARLRIWPSILYPDFSF